MSQNYYWSPSKSSFYPVAIKAVYEQAGSFPSDAVLIDDSYFATFSQQGDPTKMRGTGTDGMPAWVDATAANQQSAGLISSDAPSSATTTTSSAK